MAKIILQIVIFTIALLLKDVLSNRCTSQQTCGKCISKSPLCAWCSQENFGDNGSPRCDYVRKLLKKGCDLEYINEPVKHLKIIENKEFGHHWASDDIHIRPQEIKITLTPNSVRKFWVDFRQIQDNPLDLYFLMDLSTADKQMMIQLGNELAEELPKITSNFRIGFGTFVANHQRENCIGCVPSLAFQNVMMLSSSANRFVHMIQEASDSVNLDAPHKGMDVIIKAIVCKDQIGWRKNSRKILLYASDNYYNYTVHEQLAKTITPNDEFCHTDGNGYFSKGTKCSCTSVSQIDHHIRKSKVRVIFAVTRRKRTLYLKLSRNLSDTSIGTLDGDLSKITDLVREEYDNIRSTVEMRDNMQNGNIKLTYYSKCRGSKLEKTNYCKGLKKGTKVTFEIEMEFASCPSDLEKRNRIYSIYPVGLRAVLAVNLEMQCECDCERPGINEINSPKCSESGTFECGACTCNNSKYGRNCECSAMDEDIPLDPYMGCKENANDTTLCSGRGECICGACHCFPRENPDEIVFGRVCQCDNFLCDTHNGLLCGGPDQGRCDCGKCVCHSGWKGSDCSCRDSDEYCFNEK